MQPYVIALYTAKGIPMLWHGQEFAENWGVPGGGLGRNLFERPLHWSSFTTRSARDTRAPPPHSGHVATNASRTPQSRVLLLLRPGAPRRGVIAYRRKAVGLAPALPADLLVLLNFSESETEVWLPFPAAGTWVERIDGTRPAIHVTDGQWAAAVVPSNYGSIYERT